MGRLGEAALSPHLKDEYEFAERIRLRMVWGGREQHVQRPEGVKQHSTFGISKAGCKVGGSSGYRAREADGLDLKGP